MLCFGKAWSAADIDADTCLHTLNLVDDCSEKAWAMLDFGYQIWFEHCCGKSWATPDIINFNENVV